MPPIAKPAEQRRRRNAAPSFDLLPADGCKIRPPKWPIGEPSAEEAALWRDLWHRPVALVWHTQQIPPVVVARYVRSLVIDAADPKSRLGPVLANLESQLALTPSALARLHLKVEPLPERQNGQNGHAADDEFATYARQQGYDG